MAEAEASFDEVIRDHPSAVAYTLRAQFHLQRGAPIEKTIADLEHARALDPDYWRTHDILGHALFSAKRYEEAAESFARVELAQPNNAHSRWWRAVSLRSADRLEDAKKEVLAAVKMNPSYILRTKGKTLQELGFLSLINTSEEKLRAQLRDAAVACMIDRRCW